MRDYEYVRDYDDATIIALYVAIITIHVIEKKLKKGESICRYTNDGICVAKWRGDKRDVLMISSEFPHKMNEITTKKKEVKIKPISVKKCNENMSGVDRQDQMSAYYSFERKTLRWYKKIGFQYMYKRCKYCYAQGIRKDTIYFCNECQDQPGLCLDSCFEDFHKIFIFNVLKLEYYCDFYFLCIEVCPLKYIFVVQILRHLNFFIPDYYSPDFNIPVLCNYLCLQAPELLKFITSQQL
ncbi:hypothetical protein AGLY_013818 [Aphis glycines]|uniref:PiggyBac transposable element-derived protein domain-containing protein n=1 Tax=Aphis glycines TaxID=307491 RepID=A0A6G0T5C5_APHGL|nr:hypothetical protein AGLY_013818 [Aphis glycines]